MKMPGGKKTWDMPWLRESVPVQPRQQGELKPLGEELLDKLQELYRAISESIAPGAPVEHIWAAWGELPFNAIDKLRALVVPSAPTPAAERRCGACLHGQVCRMFTEHDNAPRQIETAASCSHYAEPGALTGGVARVGRAELKWNAERSAWLFRLRADVPEQGAKEYDSARESLVAAVDALSAAELAAAGHEEQKGTSDNAV